MIDHDFVTGDESDSEVTEDDDELLDTIDSAGDDDFASSTYDIEEDNSDVSENEGNWDGIIFRVVEACFILFVIWIVSTGYNFFFGSGGSDSFQEQQNYGGYFESRDCDSLAPVNPYTLGSGHYAGYEWGENGNFCSGNSMSFVEGCEEYDSQASAYDECLSE